MKAVFFPWLILAGVLRHCFATFESLIMRGGNKALALTMLGLIVFWHIYTPLHELMHAYACIFGGGEVTELAIKAQYGGTLLAKIFPFVVAESDYAGQLTGFTTPNYWVYAFVDFAPYLLSLFGLTVIEFAGRNNRPAWFGVGFVLAFIPFMSIPGDYYEAVSLITTQIAEMRIPGLEAGVLISDDIFRSVGELQEAGIWNTEIALLVGAGAIGAIYLASMTLGLQVVLSRFLFGEVLYRPENTATQGEPSENSPGMAFTGPA